MAFIQGRCLFKVSVKVSVKYGPNPGIYLMSQFLAYKTNASLQRHAFALVVLNKHGKGYFQPLICFPSSADTCLLH